MNRLLSLAVGLGILAFVYVLGLRRLDYASEQKRLAAKAQIKQDGLAVQYYFIPAGRLLAWWVLSGGLFGFYWLYRQWRAVCAGYRHAQGKKLAFGPLLRSVFGLISFYQLTAIVNRTCIYKRKTPAFPAAWWGTLFAGGAVAAALPLLPLWARLLGAGCFAAAPYAVQRHINLLPGTLPPLPVKLMEWLWLMLSWLIWAGLAVWFFR